MAHGNGRSRTICVTPVRNEAWILDRFLRCALMWADEIVIADQASDDGSREIASRFEHVTVVENTAPSFDEDSRQRLLLDTARRFPGPRLIVALDADEALSAACLDSEEWEAARLAPPGTAFAFDWVNVLPGATSAWIPTGRRVFAFVDDGSEHRGERIHSGRVPIPDPARIVELHEPSVLHFQYLNWKRMKSKQRWYQCWEKFEYPSKRPIQLYRQYHHMDGFPRAEVHPLDERWVAAYLDQGIDVLAPADDGLYWWDGEVFDWIVEHGPRTFEKLDVWDVEWAEVGRRLGRDVAASRVTDPRGPFVRMVHRWLAMTQRRDPGSPVTRWAQRMLIPLGW